jgi:uncharacterized protein
MIIDTIKNYVDSECKRESNMLGSAFFNQHILVVVDYGKRLAQQLNANSEVLELSAYLHDLAAIRDIKTLPTHNIISADLVDQILIEYQYPRESIAQIKQCILSHSVPLRMGEGSLEEICLSNADAISQITNLPYWLYFAFNVRKLKFDEGREWLQNRVETNWSKLIEPAQKLVDREYALAKKCLK